MPKRLLAFEIESRRNLLDRGASLVAVLFFSSLVARFGFPAHPISLKTFHAVLFFSTVFLTVFELFRGIWTKNILEFLKTRWIEIALLIPMNIQLMTALQHEGFSKTSGVLLTSLLFVFLTLEGIRNLQKSDFLSKYELTPSRLMVLSFMLPIAIGTLLLKLPLATHSPISWIDALFMAASAVCVTGLTTLNVANDFTPLGQSIIGTLIQIGGLGIVTITLSVGLMFSNGLAVRERIMFSELLAEKKLGKIGRLLTRIVVFTLGVEVIGALVIYSGLGGSFVGFDGPLFLHSFFHSMSAFCNAGISTFENGLMTASVRSNTLLTSTVMLLIVLGGLGFPAIYNLYSVLKDKLMKDRSSRTLVGSQTKLVLLSTLALLVIGAVGFFFLEDSEQYKSLSRSEGLYQALFLSVTSRTAGFNIWETGDLTLSTCLLVMFLMFIGGSPLSTAGGVKTLTFTVAWLNLFAILRGSSKVIIFGKEVASESIQRSYAIIFGSVLFLLFSVLLMILLEPDLDAFDLAFESISAFSTVGLSRGVTTELGTTSKLYLVLMMFVGRLGLIVVLNSLFDKYRAPSHRVLKEMIIIP